jgi:hypothetical protein
MTDELSVNLSADGLCPRTSTLRAISGHFISASSTAAAKSWWIALPAAYESRATAAVGGLMAKYLGAFKMDIANRLFENCGV